MQEQTIYSLAVVAGMVVLVAGLFISALFIPQYHVNAQGEVVQSPVFSLSVPDNATAQCRDGRYSFSNAYSGHCTGHGGVAKWL